MLFFAMRGSNSDHFADFPARVVASYHFLKHRTQFVA